MAPSAGFHRRYGNAGGHGTARLYVAPDRIAVENDLSFDGESIPGVERGVELVFGRDMRLGRLCIGEQHDDYVPRNIELAAARSVHDVVVSPDTVTVNARHDRPCEDRQCPDRDPDRCLRPRAHNSS